MPYIDKRVGYMQVKLEMYEIDYLLNHLKMQ